MLSPTERCRKVDPRVPNRGWEVWEISQKPPVMGTEWGMDFYGRMSSSCLWEDGDWVNRTL